MIGIRIDAGGRVESVPDRLRPRRRAGGAVLGAAGLPAQLFGFTSVTLARVVLRRPLWSRAVAVARALSVRWWASRFRAARVSFTETVFRLPAAMVNLRLPNATCLPPRAASLSRPEQPPL